MENQVTRYSDTDLAEFKALIQQKLDKANEQVAQLESQLEDVNEGHQDDGYDPDDDSLTGADTEFLTEMVIRQKKHIRDLENALLRIKNKTFGVCQVTGQLIDKKRLMAVPTTTKSLAAKMQSSANPKPNKIVRTNPKPSNTKKIISKIKTKKEQPKVNPKDIEIDDFEDEDLFHDANDEEFDLDLLPDEDFDDDTDT